MDCTSTIFVKIGVNQCRARIYYPEKKEKREDFFLLETRMTAYVLKTRPQHIKVSKERYLLGTELNVEIFGVFPSIQSVFESLVL